MAWNTSFPDSTKLRLAPALIQDNWIAIEQGGVPYDKLQLQRQVGAPASQANTGWLYAHLGTATESVLFFTDDKSPTAVTTQITNVAGIGATSQLVYCNAVQTSAFQNTQNGFCSAWAHVASNGALISGYGLTSAQTGTGHYTLTFSSAAANTTYAVIGNVFTTATRARVLYTIAQTANTFQVRTQAINASAGDYENNEFYVAVFGAR